MDEFNTIGLFQLKKRPIVPYSQPGYINETADSQTFVK